MGLGLFHHNQSEQYLIRRPKERIVGVLVYAQLLWCGPCDPWWGYELFAEMIVHYVLFLLLPWSSS